MRVHGIYNKKIYKTGIITQTFSLYRKVHIDPIYVSSSYQSNNVLTAEATGLNYYRPHIRRTGHNPPRY
jgi:hypothetical protein